MERLKKNEQMIGRILDSAQKEFARCDYQTASLNRICEDADISKGIIYHYFENKDALYLKCVELCFCHVAEAVHYSEAKQCDLRDAIRQYMKNRAVYFEEHPQEREIFFHAILRTPPALKGAIDGLKRKLDGQTLSLFRGLLEKSRINRNLSTEDALTFLRVQLDMFYQYFQMETAEKPMQDAIVEYERQVELWLDILLNGLMEKEETK